MITLHNPSIVDYKIFKEEDYYIVEWKILRDTKEPYDTLLICRKPFKYFGNAQNFLDTLLKKFNYGDTEEIEYLSLKWLFQVEKYKK